MEPQQISRSRTSSHRALCDIFSCVVLKHDTNTQKHRATKDGARSVTAVARDEGVGVRGGQATTLETSGGQATRRCASRCPYRAQTTQKTCCCSFRSCGLPSSCLAQLIARRNTSPRSLARFHDLDFPEHAPRSPAGTHACVVVYTRPVAESARKDPWPKDKIVPMRE